MAGITHEWDGAILTVTSDAGTSSANLQGPKGDTGPRGPQGPAGVIYDANGKLVLDMSEYATQDMLDEAIENFQPDLTNYATKNYVSTEIAKAQMEGAGIDTSGFATLDDIANLDINIDNRTLIKNEDGTVQTAIGGFSNGGGAVDYTLRNIEYKPSGSWNGWARQPVGNIGKKWVANCLYKITMSFKDGTGIEFNAMFEEDGEGGLKMMTKYEDDFRRMSASRYLDTFIAGPTSWWNPNFKSGEFAYIIMTDPDNDGLPNDEFVLTGITIYCDDYIPIDGHYIPVDGNSIYLNEDGKLACAVDIGEGGEVNLSNYYTKGQVDDKFDNLYIPDPDLSAYYTKSEVDSMMEAKIVYSTADLTAGFSPLATGTLYVVFE